jgi:Domain of unknown function (DUF4386)
MLRKPGVAATDFRIHRIARPAGSALEPTQSRRTSMNTILPTGSHSQHPSLRSQPTAEPNKARTDAMTAGVALLLLTALATFGALIAVDRVVTTGNAARTAADITQSLTTFRLGIAALLAVAALDIVVAYALQRFLAPVSHGLSTLAAWLRVAYAAVFATAIAHLAGAARLVGDQTTDVGQVLGKVDTYRDTWSAGLVLFGVHLLVVGFLLLRSGFTSKWLGVLVGLAGVGYLIDSLVDVLSNGSWPSVATVTGIGEFILAVWLLVRGGRHRAAGPV